MVPDTHLLKVLFLTRYVNCSLERSANFLASPWGEVALRSDDGEGTVSVAIKYRSSQQQFSRAIGHNANFVWNQDEASVKFDRQ